MIILRLAYSTLILMLISVLCSSCVKYDKPVLNQKEALSSVLWQLAAASEIDKDYETAASHYNRLYEKHPNDKKVIIAYTRNLRYVGLSNESIKILKLKLIQFPDDTNIQMELGKSQLAASLINDASDTLVKVIERQPESWEAHSALGIIFDRVGSYQKAKTAYKRALELSPNNIAVQNNIALSMAQAGEINQAINLLEEVNKDKMAGPQSRQNLALLYGLKGQLEKVRELSQVDLPKNLVDRNFLIFKEMRSSQ